MSIKKVHICDFCQLQKPPGSMLAITLVPRSGGETFPCDFRLEEISGNDFHDVRKHICEDCRITFAEALEEANHEPYE